jgi:hypothetical protein
MLLSRFGWGFALVLALVALAGCEKPDPKFYPVTGKVEFQGKPANGFTVEFASQNAETKDLNARGIVDENGAFQLKSTWNGKEKDGAVAGQHKVVIVPPPAASGGPSVLPIPYRYADYNQSGLTFEVKPDGTNEYKPQLAK